MPRTVGPLGVLIPDQLQPDIINRLNGIEQTDLAAVTHVISVTRTAEIPPEEADTVVRELKRFLSLNILVQDPDYSFVPSSKVDLAWHEFILDTKAYMSFCDSYLGGYVHHVPQVSRAVSRAQVSGEPYLYTKRKLQEFYGATPPFIWGIPNACDTGLVCNSILQRTV